MATDMNREEVEAKLAAAEAMLEARLSAAIRAELRIQLASIQGEMHKNTADLIKWGFYLAAAAVVMTVILLSYAN